jgi:hypothetical protein
MDPNGIRSMVIKDFLGDTDGSLKYIDTINPKANELSGNLILTFRFLLLMLP